MFSLKRYSKMCIQKLSLLFNVSAPVGSVREKYYNRDELSGRDAALHHQRYQPRRQSRQSGVRDGHPRQTRAA